MKYARALADVAIEVGEPAEGLTQLQNFAQMYEAMAELREAMANPSLPLKVKQAVLSGISERVGYRKIVRNFLLVLVERNRIGQIVEICRAYEQVLDQFAGVVRVEVLSAKPLQPAVRERVAQVMSEVTGSQVNLSYAVDEGLIGGLKLQVGSTVFDGSVKAELEQIGHQLTG